MWTPGTRYAVVRDVRSVTCDCVELSSGPVQAPASRHQDPAPAAAVLLVVIRAHAAQP